MADEDLASEVIIGVDTHDGAHVAVAIDGVGRRIGDVTIPTTAKGYASFVTWAGALGGVASVAMEGTGSYGRALCEVLARRGITVSRSHDQTGANGGTAVSPTCWMRRLPLAPALRAR